jgi:hypothetical protein
VKSFAERLVSDEVIEFVGSDCHHQHHLEMIEIARQLPFFHQLIRQKQILNNKL